MTITKSETLICYIYFCSAINSSPLIAPLCYLKKCSLIHWSGKGGQWCKTFLLKSFWIPLQPLADCLTLKPIAFCHYCIASNCILMSFDRCAFHPIVFCHSDVGNVSKASSSCSPGVLHQIDVQDLQSNYRVHPANNKYISRITTDPGIA